MNTITRTVYHLTHAERDSMQRLIDELASALNNATMWARGYEDATNQRTPWRNECESVLAKVRK